MFVQGSKARPKIDQTSKTWTKNRQKNRPNLDQISANIDQTSTNHQKHQKTSKHQKHSPNRLCKHCRLASPLFWPNNFVPTLVPVMCSTLVTFEFTSFELLAILSLLGCVFQKFPKQTYLPTLYGISTLKKLRRMQQAQRSRL